MIGKMVGLACALGAAYAWGARSESVMRGYAVERAHLDGLRLGLQGADGITPREVLHRTPWPTGPTLAEHVREREQPLVDKVRERLERWGSAWDTVMAQALSFDASRDLDGPLAEVGVDRAGTIHMRTGGRRNGKAAAAQRVVDSLRAQGVDVQVVGGKGKDDDGVEVTDESGTWLETDDTLEHLRALRDTSQARREHLRMWTNATPTGEWVDASQPMDVAGYSGEHSVAERLRDTPPQDWPDPRPPEPGKAWAPSEGLADLGDLPVGVDPFPGQEPQRYTTGLPAEGADMAAERRLFQEPDDAFARLGDLLMDDAGKHYDDVTEDGVSRTYPGRAGG